MAEFKTERSVYTVNEAADILRMGRSTLYRLIKENRVPYRRLENGVRLTNDDIDAILVEAHRPAVA